MEIKTCGIIFGENAHVKKPEALLRKLRAEFLDAVNSGYTVFVCKLTNYTELLFFEAVIGWKKSYPQICLEGLPSEEFVSAEQARCKKILSACNIIYCGKQLSPEQYIKACSQKLILADGAF